MKPIRWFEIIVLFAVLTLLIVYFVPSDSPFFVVRYVFSFVYVTILPGYCLVSILFTNLDTVEKAVLSVALSFGVAGLSGLFLGLSPIGFSSTSITVSLSAIVLVLAAVAFVKKSRELRKLQVQSVEHASSS
jgi:uncharacterized membrane protein